MNFIAHEKQRSHYNDKNEQNYGILAKIWSKTRFETPGVWEEASGEDEGLVVVDKGLDDAEVAGVLQTTSFQLFLEKLKMLCLDRVHRPEHIPIYRGRAWRCCDWASVCPAIVRINHIHQFPIGNFMYFWIFCRYTPL